MSLATSLFESLDLVLMLIVRDMNATDGEDKAVDSVPDLGWKTEEVRGFCIITRTSDLVSDTM